MAASKAIRAILIMLAMWVTMITQSYAGDRTLGEYIQTKCSKHCVTPERLAEGLLLSAMTNDLDPSLLLAVVRVESAFNTRASNQGNVGLTQTLLRYHKPKYRGRNVYDVHANLEVGGSVLRDCLKRRKHNLDKALRCYNGNADPRYPYKVRTALREIRALQDFL